MYVINMIVYIVASQTEWRDWASHYIHCITMDYAIAYDAFESVIEKHQRDVVLLKADGDKVFDYELFGSSNTNGVEVVKIPPGL